MKEHNIVLNDIEVNLIDTLLREEIIEIEKQVRKLDYQSEDENTRSIIRSYYLTLNRLAELRAKFR